MEFKYVNNIPIVKPEYIINRSQILFENARTGSDRLLQEESFFFFSLQLNHSEHAQSHLISEAKQGQGLVSTWMGEAYHFKIKKSNFSFELVIRGCNIQSKPGITENRSFNWFFFFQRQPIS